MGKGGRKVTPFQYDAFYCVVVVYHHLRIHHVQSNNALIFLQVCFVTQHANIFRGPVVSSYMRYFPPGTGYVQRIA